MRHAGRFDAAILIVDDAEANVRFLKTILNQEGYSRVETMTDPREVPGRLSEGLPDILLLDLHMPHMDGYEVLEEISSIVGREVFLPIIVLTADISDDARKRALRLGASDFVTKPFDPAEVLLRLSNLLDTRLLHVQLRSQNEQLEQRVAARTHELERAQLECLERLALAAEFRDDATGQHTQRVGRTSALIAEALELPTAEITIMRKAAPLHDIGKIGIPDSILLKPGRLTPDEFEVMKTHSVIGQRILAGSGSNLLQTAEVIVLTHHERWDGTGYWGMDGKDIPMFGRIVAIADVFDALTHDRPYKRAWPEPDAVAEIQAQRGRQFDPDVVDAFMAVRAKHDLIRQPERKLHLRHA
jgi:putative two-component system response regulator